MSVNFTAQPRGFSEAMFKKEAPRIITHFLNYKPKG